MPTSVSQFARYAGPWRPNRFDGVVTMPARWPASMSARSSDRASTRWPPSVSGGADVTMVMTAIRSEADLGRKARKRPKAQGIGIVPRSSIGCLVISARECRRPSRRQARLADDSAGADDRAVADRDAVENLRARAEPDAVADVDAGGSPRLVQHRLRVIGEVVIAARRDRHTPRSACPIRRARGWPKTSRS